MFHRKFRYVVFPFSQNVINTVSEIRKNMDHRVFALFQGVYECQKRKKFQNVTNTVLKRTFDFDIFSPNDAFQMLSGERPGQYWACCFCVPVKQFFHGMNYGHPLGVQRHVLPN